MALDLVVERSEHEPIESVSLDVAVCGLLMPLVLSLEPRAFLRLADYYEDAEISVEELADFAEEVGNVRTLPAAPAAVMDVARQIQSLAKTALREGLPIRAYAD